jgi:hypothetical protein
MRAASAVCLAILAFAATTVAAQARSCVRATIGEPYVLPDGSRHAGGLLRICLDRAYSPVSGLHTIVAGNVSGTFLSRRGRPESGGEPAAPPRILFARDARHRLHLLGYAVPASGGTEVYWIGRSGG